MKPLFGLRLLIKATINAAIAIMRVFNPAHRMSKRHRIADDIEVLFCELVLEGGFIIPLAILILAIK